MALRQLRRPPREAEGRSEGARLAPSAPPEHAQRRVLLVSMPRFYFSREHATCRGFWWACAFSRPSGEHATFVVSFEDAALSRLPYEPTTGPCRFEHVILAVRSILSQCRIFESFFSPCRIFESFLSPFLVNVDREMQCVCVHRGSLDSGTSTRARADSLSVSAAPFLCSCRAVLSLYVRPERLVFTRVEQTEFLALYRNDISQVSPVFLPRAVRQLSYVTYFGVIATLERSKIQALESCEV